MIDSRANFNILDPEGLTIGRIERRGLKSRIKAVIDSAVTFVKDGIDINNIVSIWDVSYHIYENEGQEIGQIIEKNPKTKFIGTLLTEVFLARPLLNPIYAVETHGESILCACKQPAFFARTFVLEKQQEFSTPNETLLLCGLIITFFVERKLGI